MLVMPGWGRGGLPAGAPGRFSDVSQAVVDGRRLASGGCGDDHDPAERLDDLVGPRPAAGQPEVSAPAAADEAGGDVQHPEPQRLGFGGGHVAVEGEQPQPGGQIGGHGDDLQPGLVDRVLP